MDKIHELINHINESKQILDSLDLLKVLHDMEKLKYDNDKLRKEIDNLQNKYNKDMEIKINELQQKSDDVTNLTKVSIVQTLNKQLNEKTNYIQILESQLEKLRNTKVSNPEPLIEEQKEKHKIEPNPVPLIEEQKEKHHVPVLAEFVPEEFEEVNGYELFVYKKIYYLRDLETNEFYNIINNMPNMKVGFINSNGKPKFNK